MDLRARGQLFYTTIKHSLDNARKTNTTGHAFLCSLINMQLFSSCHYCLDPTKTETRFPNYQSDPVTFEGKKQVHILSISWTFDKLCLFVET